MCPSLQRYSGAVAVCCLSTTEVDIVIRGLLDMKTDHDCPDQLQGSKVMIRVGHRKQ